MVIINHNHFVHSHSLTLMMIAARITILTTDQIAICVVVQPVVFASLSDEIAAGKSEASR